MSISKNESVDTAIQDLHQWRRELSDKFQGNIRAIMEDAISRQDQSRRRVIRRIPSTNPPLQPSDQPGLSDPASPKIDS